MSRVTRLDLHGNGLPRQLDEAGLRQILDELLAAGGRLVFQEHVYLRMEERDVTVAQIVQVLRRGELVSGPRWDATRETWKFTLRADTAGESVCVGAALDIDRLMGRIVVVITVFVE